MSFFKKIFVTREIKFKTIKHPDQTTGNEVAVSFDSLITTSNGIPEIVTRYQEIYKGKALSELNNLYFDLLDKLMIAKKNNDFNTLLMHCQGSLGLLESVIEYQKNEFGSFRIKSIPAIDYSLIYFSIFGNTGQLKNIQDIVNYFEELHQYRDKVDIAFIRRKISAMIYQYVKANPNCTYEDLKKNINFDDGRFISSTINYMEKVGKLIKKKEVNKVLLTVKLK